MKIGPTEWLAGSLGVVGLTLFVQVIREKVSRWRVRRHYARQDKRAVALDLFRRD